MKSADSYILRIRAGPSIDKLALINPNDEQNPILIASPSFTGYMCVRVLNFNGVVPPNAPHIPTPNSSYFQGRNRRYSIMTQGRFHERFNGNDIVFGLEFDDKVRLPSGVGLAMKIAQWLDPALRADLYADKPWIMSPFVTAMNALAVYDETSPEVWDGRSGEDVAKGRGNKITPVGGTPTSVVQNANGGNEKSTGLWSFHSRMIPEETDGLFEEDSPGLVSYEKRKKYFADEKNRERAVILPSKIYAMDFYDAYFDFNSISFKLPGFTVNALRYFDGQAMRFIAKSRDGKHVFYVVEFTLMERDEGESDYSSQADS
ncbi:hypothetical protein HK096_006229 [Nowakowskiella sp. JEL0078]|nr:hypothetical protein HK096_006229 [Nowakowskiella sp. JEL0078]